MISICFDFFYNLMFLPITQVNMIFVPWVPIVIIKLLYFQICIRISFFSCHPKYLFLFQFQFKLLKWRFICSLSIWSNVNIIEPNELTQMVPLLMIHKLRLDRLLLHIINKEFCQNHRQYSWFQVLKTEFLNHFLSPMYEAQSLRLWK